MTTLFIISIVASVLAIISLAINSGKQSQKDNNIERILKESEAKIQQP